MFLEDLALEKHTFADSESIWLRAGSKVAACMSEFSLKCPQSRSDAKQRLDLRGTFVSAGKAEKESQTPPSYGVRLRKKKSRMCEFDHTIGNTFGRKSKLLPTLSARRTCSVDSLASPSSENNAYNL